jgi:hypothetical protein
LLMVLGLALTAGEASAQTSRDKVLYLACYMFTPGGDGTAIAFIPDKTTAGVLGRMYPESKLADSGVIAARGYRTSRCASFDTAELAEAWYRASGYHIINKFGYPKGFWPDPQAPRPAQPPKWALCTMETGGGVGSQLARLVIEPFQIALDKVPLQSAGMTFEREVGVGSIIPGHRPFNGTGSCDYYDTEAVARAQRDRWQYSRNYAIVKFVDWRPPASVTGLGDAKGPVKVTGSAGGPGNPKDKSGETVKPIDTGIRDAGKAWDEQVKKALAEEARKKVEIAANTAQANAKAQADAEAFFRERRKQGRAQ